MTDFLRTETDNSLASDKATFKKKIFSFIQNNLRKQFEVYSQLDLVLVAKQPREQKEKRSAW